MLEDECVGKKIKIHCLLKYIEYSYEGSDELTYPMFAYMVIAGGAIIFILLTLLVSCV